MEPAHMSERKPCPLCGTMSPLDGPHSGTSTVGTFACFGNCRVVTFVADRQLA